MTRDIQLVPDTAAPSERLASLIDAQLLLADLQSGLRVGLVRSGWSSRVRHDRRRHDTLDAISRHLVAHPDLAQVVRRLRSSLVASEGWLPAPWWTGRFASARQTHAHLEGLVTEVAKRIREAPGDGWRPLEGSESRREPKSPRRLSYRRQRVAAG